MAISKMDVTIMSLITTVKHEQAFLNFSALVNLGAFPRDVQTATVTAQRPTLRASGILVKQG